MSPFTFVIAGAQRILCFFVVVFLLSSPYCLIWVASLLLDILQAKHETLGDTGINRRLMNTQCRQIGFFVRFDDKLPETSF